MKKTSFTVIIVSICLLASDFYAQIDSSDTKNQIKKIVNLDINSELNKRKEKWNKQDILCILICPRIMGSDDDPLAVSGEKKQLSVLGFGRLDKKNASIFISSINTETIKVPRLTGGVYVDLYFLFEKSPASMSDIVTCYIAEGTVDMRIDDGNGGYQWVGLSAECSKYISNNFVKKD
jgi:hypothetical protein